jgi:hypothetical protein
MILDVPSVSSWLVLLISTGGNTTIKWYTNCGRDGDGDEDGDGEDDDDDDGYDDGGSVVGGRGTMTVGGRGTMTVGDDDGATQQSNQ